MKNPEIIDNSEDNKLIDFLNSKLEDNKNNFDVATAFFNIEAFSMVRDELEGVERFRLLLGKSPEFENDRTLGDEIQDYIESDVEGLEFTRENRDAVRKLIEFLDQDNVEVRLYDEKFLHGKAYIWDDEVVIGSSNFTAAGLSSNNELNSVGPRSKARYTREEWFEKFWEKAEPFNEDLIQLLDRSRFGTAEYSPYEVFLKTLYEYQKEDLEQDIQSKNDRNSDVDLTEFQEDAVGRVFTRMRKYGGCLVADSVGLGKTYVAKRVIEEFGFIQRKNFMVVSPASLEGMWEDEMKDIGVSENIVTQEAIARDNYLEKAERATGSNLEDVELIVVDESHNFRNPESNRWENLFTLMNEHIDAEGKKPYVLFLTATPINNTVWDLYWQLMLMLEYDRSAFIKEGIKDLYRRFQKVDDAGEPSLLNDVLNEISVRRTREYIQENYPDATYEDEHGNKIKLNFPERKLNDFTYELDDAYQGYFEKISKKIKNDLTMAYYRQLEYKNKQELTQEEELQRGRMKGMEGIFQKILLKRLESSVGAFRKSIDNHIEFMENLERHMDDGKFLTKKTYRKHILEVEEEIPEGEYREELEEFEKDDYDYDKLIEDLEHDIHVLEDIKDLISDIGHEQDSKLQKLENEVVRLSEDEQVVLFAFYSDTIQYLYDYLTNSEKLEDKNIEMLTGDSSTRERERTIEAYMEGNVDIILSTDVLSEGQNLQKAKHLINYDLHWNPTRMIQRAGRIDRIGTPHDKIWIHNFFPSDELEDLLELVKVLEQKVSDIDESVGLDQKVLDEDINPKVFGTTSSLDDETLEKIRNNDDSVMDDLSNDQLGGGEDFWQPIKRFMQENAKEKLEKMPKGIYSGHKDDARGIFFYYQYGDDFHYWYFYDLENNQLIDNKTEILRMIKVGPEVDREVPDFFDEVFERSSEVREDIELEYKDVEQGSKDSKFREWDEDHATKFLKKVVRSLNIELRDHLKKFPEDEETEKQIEKIDEKLRTITLTKQRTKDVRQLWRDYKGENGHGDWKKLSNQLEDYLNDKSSSVGTELEEFDPEKLDLITVEFIS